MTVTLLRINGTEVPCVPGGSRAYSPTDLVLSRPVGVGAALNGPDVLTVQKALNDIPPGLGGPSIKLAPDSIAGTKTITAIKDFQQHHFGFKDGRVDLFGKTHAKLSSSRPAKQAFVARAKDYLQDALKSVRAADTRLLQAQAELVTGGGLMGRRNLELADRHFDVLKSPSPTEAINELKSVYQRMLAVFIRPGGLWGFHAFDADPFTNPDGGAFTWWGGFSLAGRYIGWHRLDAIYICEAYLAAPADYKVFALVHELAHFVGPPTGNVIDDHAFGRSTNPKVKALPPALKRRNAQSLANFAFEAQYGREGAGLGG